MSKTVLPAGIIFCIASIILGAVILINPNTTTVVLTIFISIFMAISGLGSIIFYFKIRKLTDMRALVYLLDGLVSLILGILIITNQSIIANFIPTVIGIWLILKSITGIFFTGSLKSSGTKSWLSVALISAFGIIIGILIIKFPIIIQLYISFVIGGFFIFMGLISLFIMIRAIKLYKAQQETYIDI